MKVKKTASELKEVKPIGGCKESGTISCLILMVAPSCVAVTGGFFMSKSVKVAKAGRPNKFNAEQVRLFKSVVREFGLTGAIPVLLERGLSVSVPTLSKYVSSGAGGRPPIKLRRGRRKKVAVVAA